MKENVTTHKQHYVWRRYLRPWCTLVNIEKEDYYIWWNNKKIHKFTNIFDILRQEDFYKFDILNKLELFLLKNVFAKTNQSVVASANKIISDMVDIISSFNSESVTKEIDDYLIQIGEELQSSIEKSAVKSLDSLYKLNLSFLNDEDERMNFILFLCFQYFRTKCMKDNVANAMFHSNDETRMRYSREFNDKKEYEIDWNKIYNYGHIFLAHELAYNLSLLNVHFRILKNSNCRFIVSDQPIYNCGETEWNECILFYPITPNIAVIVSKDFEKDEIIEISDYDVMYYNNNTLKHVHNFFMGKDEKDVDLKFPYK